MSTARTAPLRITEPSRATVNAVSAQLPAAPCHGVLIKAICPGQTIYLGRSAVSAATGWPMADGDVLDLAVKNVNEIYAVATAAGQSLALMPYSIY